jgi:hypothetical protein
MSARERRSSASRQSALKVRKAASRITSGRPAASEMLAPILALIALMLLAPMFGLFANLLRVGFGLRVLIAEHHVGFAG